MHIESISDLTSASMLNNADILGSKLFICLVLKKFMNSNVNLVKVFIYFLPMAVLMEYHSLMQECA